MVGDGGGGGLPVRLSQNPFFGFPLHTQFNAVLHSVLSRTAPQFTVGDAVGGFVGKGVVGLDVGWGRVGKAVGSGVGAFVGEAVVGEGVGGGGPHV